MEKLNGATRDLSRNRESNDDFKQRGKDFSGKSIAIAGGGQRDGAHKGRACAYLGDLLKSVSFKSITTTSSRWWYGNEAASTQEIRPSYSELNEAEKKILRKLFTPAGKGSDKGGEDACTEFEIRNLQPKEILQERVRILEKAREANNNVISESPNEMGFHTVSDENKCIAGWVKYKDKKSDKGLGRSVTEKIFPNPPAMRRGGGKGSFKQMDGEHSLSSFKMVYGGTAKLRMLHSGELVEDVQTLKNKQELFSRIEEFLGDDRKYVSIQHLVARDEEGRGLLLARLADGGCLGGSRKQHSIGTFEGIFRALKNMHEHDFVHRDIKPDNVLIGRDPLPVDVLLKKTKGQPLQYTDALRGPEYAVLTDFDGICDINNPDDGAQTPLYLPRSLQYASLEDWKNYGKELDNYAGLLVAMQGTEKIRPLEIHDKDGNLSDKAEEWCRHYAAQEFSEAIRKILLDVKH